MRALSGFSASEALLIGSYFAVMGLLGIYGLHRLALLCLLGRKAHRAAVSQRKAWPIVTVQLPIMNERYVVERLLRAAGALDYPRDRLEIQILDDSDDDTTAIAELVSGELRREGLKVEHLRRRGRDGFKAGALAAGTARARGELCLILDADFVPPTDLLRQVVPLFSDPGLGLVQARWGHLNESASLLTRAQALMLDGHFAVEHAARFRSGWIFNFNGTAGVFRREAIEAAGGWQSDSLTEDLDLSYRMQLQGYRAVYLHDIVVPGELPTSLLALKSQQYRWAKGSLETCRKLLPTVFRSQLPLASKIEATFHLTDNVAYLLLLLLSVLSLPALAIRAGHGARALFWADLALFGSGAGTLFLFYIVAAARSGGVRRAASVPLLMALGIGLSPNNALAVVGGLLGRRSPFVRTPKTGGAPGSGYAPRRDRLFVLEGCLAAWALLGVAYTLWERLYLPLPFFLLFASGYLWVGGASFLAACRQGVIIDKAHPLVAKEA